MGALLATISANFREGWRGFFGVKGLISSCKGFVAIVAQGGLVCGFLLWPLSAGERLVGPFARDQQRQTLGSVLGRRFDAAAWGRAPQLPRASA